MSDSDLLLWNWSNLNQPQLKVFENSARMIMTQFSRFIGEHISVIHKVLDREKVMVLETAWLQFNTEPRGIKAL